MNRLWAPASTLIPRIRRKAAGLLTNEQKLAISEIRHGEAAWQQRAKSALRGRSRGGSAPVAEAAHDVLAARTSNLEAVSAALRSADIDFVELPRRAADPTRLVIPQARLRRAVAALRRLKSEDGWSTRRRDVFGAPVSARKLDETAEIVCRRTTRTHGGATLNTPIEDVLIEPWPDLEPRRPRVDGSTHVPGTLHRVIEQPRTLVEYFTPETWAASVANGNRAELPQRPNLYAVSGPVDLVYTWVDGSDPVWQRKKAEALAAITGREFNLTAVSESRFADRNELRYSLRSVESYASWVNHIYLVTDSQIPPWLNTDHPKLTVIDHRDIFTDRSHLPVFNSHAIESQLHHIPGLSEKYLYMNDDLFFLRPTTAELFFTGNGLSRFFPSTAPLDLDEPSARDLPVLSAAKHGRQFMLDHHGRFVGNKFKHTPHPQLRSVMADFEAEFPTLFDAVAASTFRDPDDYSIASALYHFHAYAQGKAIDSPIRYAYMDISRPDAELYMRRLLRRRDLDVLCLNDTDSSPEKQDYLDGIVASFLEEKFPLPSSFEKPRTT